MARLPLPWHVALGAAATLDLPLCLSCPQNEESYAIYQSMRAYVAGSIMSCFGYLAYIFLVEEKESSGEAPAKDKAAAHETQA